jgi:hypothetical protein
MEITQIAKILGGKKALHRKINDRLDLIELSDRGLTKDALLNLAR